MAVFGFVVADSEKAIARLGNKLVIEHTLEHLGAARSVDRIICYTNLPSKKLKTLCTTHPITSEFVANPIAAVREKFPEVTRAIVVSALAATITTATYEKCLRKLNADTPYVLPGRKQPMLVDKGKTQEIERAFVPIEHMTAYDPCAEYPTTKTYGTVEVDILQTLDLEDPFHFQIVEAILAQEKKWLKNSVVSVPRKYLGGVALPVHSAISKTKRTPKKS